MTIKTNITNYDVALTTIINYIFRSKLYFSILLLTKLFIIYYLITGEFFIESIIVFWLVNFSVEIATIALIFTNIYKYKKAFGGNTEVTYKIDENSFESKTSLGKVEVRKKDISEIKIKRTHIIVYERDIAKIFILRKSLTNEELEFIRNYR